MKLVTIADMKTYLEISSSNFDDLLTLIVEDISSRIQHFTNRYLKKEERTEYFDVRNSRRDFQLKAYPIDLDEDFTASQYGIEDTINSDYYVYEQSGVVRYYTPRNNCNEPKCLSVTYSGGYDEIIVGSETVISVPDDIRRACSRQVQFEFRRRKDIGVQSVTTPDGSISRAVSNEFLPEVENTLKSYRNFAKTRY